MNFYIRLLCYTDPSRQYTKQIHSDIRVDTFPQYYYSQPLHVGQDDSDPLFWPVYVVGNFPLMRQIDDPEHPGEKTLLITVFVVEKDAWGYFDMPAVVKQAFETKVKTPRI